MSIETFVSQCSFYDAVNFPHGFSRSGDFTKTEADILTQCGYTIKQLLNNNIAPESEEHKHFLAVISGEAEPSNAIEKAWIKYLTITDQRRTTKRCSLTGSMSDSDYSGDDYSDDD